jgi:hypothetical protein
VCVCLRCPLPTYLGGVAALATPASPLGPAAFLHERDVDPFVATVAQQVENRAYQERALTALVYLLSPPGYSSLRSVEKERWGESLGTRDSASGQGGEQPSVTHSTPVMWCVHVQALPRLGSLCGLGAGGCIFYLLAAVTQHPDSAAVCGAALHVFHKATFIVPDTAMYMCLVLAILDALQRHA